MPSNSASAHSKDVKRRIVERLRDKPFERAFEDETFRELLEEDALGEAPIFTADAIAGLNEARELRHQKRAATAPSLFFSNKSVLIVPGFLGSQLRDDGPAGNDLIWIDPKLYITSTAQRSELSALQMAPWKEGEPERDRDPNVSVREDGGVPIIYAGLKYYLESGRCEVRTAGFDWRKDIDGSAGRLVQTIRAFANEHPGRPFFLVAHSQGSLVARRALQVLGKEEARRLVNRLILLGPASYGTFSAAFAIAGNHSLIASLANYGLKWPDNLKEVMQSFSGLYQLLPWKPGTVGMDPGGMAASDFWETGVDRDRLAEFFRWGAAVDTSFFNDRTSIILGDDPDTPSAVRFVDGVLTTVETAQGDGTVPDACAILDGVSDLARAAGADHMTLPLKHPVMQTIWRIITANLTMQSFRNPSFTPGEHKIMPLPEPVDLFKLAGVRRAESRPRPGGKRKAARAVDPAQIDLAAAPPSPTVRRLRVFSYDPLLAIDPDSLGQESIVLKLNWDDESNDGLKLQPGPIGEYLEVVDYDPASRCFYAPVDLNHPNLLAQDGVPLSESDPQFHQQMVYAVGMATIAIFERALGRVIQWSPHLERDDTGEVVRTDSEFVRRLRIYPHAMREPNAYYDPARKAVLFGYFPAEGRPGGRLIPNGTVFTCLSYDVIAHEITHAILDGCHRYFLESSNADVLAFHEAFADIVALFQHFSHPEVLRAQIAKVDGQLDAEGLLGELAQQFGEAMGMHGSLRSYLGKRNDKGVWEPIKPDPTLIGSTDEPHDRGSLLVAAMFTAFLTIYNHNTKDLLRIASSNHNLLPHLHADLISRMTHEAARAAKHLLTMAIRALDYAPPVDLNFGNYLRALITSDYDISPSDGVLHRVAIVDAFRQWGIYPEHVTSLSVDSLLWYPPQSATLKLNLEIFREILNIGSGNLNLDRAELYQRQRGVQAQLHDWMREHFAVDPKLATEWGLDVSPGAPQTIARDDRPKLVESGQPRHLPKFEIHSVRRCRRIGPDGQERVDILIEVLQRRDGYFDEGDQAAADAGRPPKGGKDFIFRGGATLIVDPRAGRIRFAIIKLIGSASRLEKVRDYYGGHDAALGLRGNYFRPDRDANPFPHLHGTED